MEFNGTFFVTIITFIVFVILMNKILYAPILNIMAERKSFIESNYKSAQKNDEKSNALLQEKEEKLIEAKDDARNKYNEILDEFKSQRAEIVVDAQDTSKDKLENFKVELENISNDTKQKLKSSMTDLASDIVEKVIGYRSEVQGFDSRTIDEILYH